MASSEGIFKFDKLNENNYPAWSFKMKMLLAREGAWEVVEKDVPATKPQGWDEKCQKALQIIVLMVENSQVCYINECKTGREAWEILKDIYHPDDTAAQVRIISKLLNTKLEYGESMHRHLGKIFDLISTLKEMGMNLPEGFYVSALLSSLNESYNAVVSAIHAWDGKQMKLSMVRAKLLEEYERVHRGESGSSVARSKPVFTCYLCGQPGHTKRYCPDLRKLIKQKRKLVTEKKDDDDNKGSRSAKASRIAGWYKSVSINNKEIPDWIVDSGATNHMCADRNLFTTMRNENLGKVSTAGSELIEAKGTGEVDLELIVNNRTVKVTLHNVLWIPKLTGNIVSVKCLTDRGFYVAFTKQKCTLKDGKESMVIAWQRHGLYQIPVVTKCKKVTGMDDDIRCVHEWHKVLAHRNLSDIRKMRNFGLKIKDCKCDNDCEACVKGKMARKSFPKKATPTKEILDCVASDICGPMQVETFGKKRYFITFIDIHTKYTEVQLMREKSEAPRLIIEYIEKMKTQLGKKPKIFRSDRGTEYMSRNLQEYFKKEGIKFQCTVGYAPEQNGVAERMNRTLVEAVRSMLSDSGMSKSYWGEAVSAACHTFNSIPNEEGKIPYEMIYNYKPRLTGFHEFGCDVYSMIPYEKRRKLDDKAMKYKFVGYDENSKGYRLADKNHKIVISREVHFLKSKEKSVDNNAATETVDNGVFISLGNDGVVNQEEEENFHDAIEDFEEEQDDFQIDQNEFNEDENPIQEEVVQVEQIQEEPRRTTRHNAGKMPEKYNDYVTYNAKYDDVYFEPKTYKQAVSCKYAKEWKAAMQEELDAINVNNTWVLCDLPPGRKAVGSKWVFKLKMDGSGNIIRRKARLVAQGFSQKYGVDYDEVFAPVVRSSTFRLLLSVAGVQGYQVNQFDIKSAFLNGNLNEEIYMKQPTGFEKGEKVYRLKKSLYGLKQAARVWNQTLHDELMKNGCRQSETDKCLYILEDKKFICYLLVHVDDMLVAYNNKSLMNKLMSSIGKKFEMKDLGPAKRFLEIDIAKDKEGNFTLSQEKYIEKILNETGLSDAKISQYPLDTGYFKIENSDFLDSNEEYRKIIGMLLYLTSHTRPDISAAVSILSQRVTRPRLVDLNEAKRVLRYLKGTKSLKLMMSDKFCGEKLYAFSDANWAEDREDRKSNSGYYCSVNGGAISWSCRKQDMVTLSSTEAEFVALSETCKEISWLRRIVNDFKIEKEASTTIYTDSQSALAMINNQKFSNRTKHIDTRYHYIRDKVMNKEVKLKYESTEKNIADMMTKPLGRVKIQDLRRKAGLLNVSIEEEC